MWAVDAVAPPTRRRMVALLGALVLAAPSARAQGSVGERLGLDRLRFSAVGVQVGVVRPSKIERTESYTLQVDYGEVAPRWRVLFTTTFWSSRFTDDAVRGFADSLRQVIDDPTGDASVRLGDIAVSDISLGTEVRRILAPGGWYQTWAGGGLMAHVLNADGRLIDGTFVERATDTINIGLTGSVGADVFVFRHVALGVQARYDLLSFARYASLRVGGSWFFDAIPSSRPRSP